MGRQGMKRLRMAAITWLFAIIANATPAPFSNLIVFGDSLSDGASLSSEPNMAKEKNSGNNYWAQSLGKIGAPITSLNPASHLASLWTNDLTRDTKLFDANPNHTYYIYPWRQAHTIGLSPLRYSMSYAWASAETGDLYLNDLDLNEKTYPPFVFASYDQNLCSSNGPGFISTSHSCVPGVILQVKEYLQDVNQHPNPRSLFIIWAGGNDIFNNAAKIADNNLHENKIILLFKMLNTAYPLSPKMGVEPLSNPILQIKQAVALLIQAGVSPNNIYVINMPNLARTPAAHVIANGQKTILYLWAFISKIFNIALEIMLVFDYHHPEFNLPRHHIISSSNILNNLLSHEKEYGFSMGYQSCVTNNATPYCPGYIFFNDKHPTAETHVEIANSLTKILLQQPH